jgi:hypothetical protein
MKAIAEMTQTELAAYVQGHLMKRGIDVVLSGGAAVALYSQGKYVSMDIDLVKRYFTKRSAIVKAMHELGFTETGRHFKHPDTEYFVEFPAGPLAIGESQVQGIDELPLDTGVLRVISPTECVKDRLVLFYHWGDLQCLEQALMVAASHPIDLVEIEDWSRIEGKSDAFLEFRHRLEAG